LVTIMSGLNAANAKATAHLTSMSSDQEKLTALRETIPAYQAANNAFLRMGLTGQGATDVRTLVADDSRMLADIQIGNGPAIVQDSQVAAGALEAVRADVGLPPSTSGG
jgi:hypothetical protein